MVVNSTDEADRGQVARALLRSLRLEEAPRGDFPKTRGCRPRGHPHSSTVSRGAESPSGAAPRTPTLFWVQVTGATSLKHKVSHNRWTALPRTRPVLDTDRHDCLQSCNQDLASDNAPCNAKRRPARTSPEPFWCAKAPRKCPYQAGPRPVRPSPRLLLLGTLSLPQTSEPE